MAATFLKNIRFHSSTDGVKPATRIVDMAASQGIYIPDSLAYLSTSGTAKRAATSAGSDAINLMLTDKPAAAHSVNDQVVATVIERRLKLAVYVENNGSDILIAQANVGNQYGVVVSATAGEIGFATLDLNDTTNKVFDVDDIMSNLDDVKFTETTSPGVAIVKVLESVIEATKA